MFFSCNNIKYIKEYFFFFVLQVFHARKTEKSKMAVEDHVILWWVWRGLDPHKDCQYLIQSPTTASFFVSFLFISTIKQISLFQTQTIYMCIHIIIYIRITTSSFLINCLRGRKHLPQLPFFLINNYSSDQSVVLIK